jgi:queuine tRNA-ribosyltransferase
MSDYSVNEQLKKPYGLHFSSIEEIKPFQQWAGHEEKPLFYYTGDVDLSVIDQLSEIGIDFVESNKPANDGYHGRVYCSQGVFSIQQKALEMQFAAIDEHCDCPTCRQHFTRAYLHHLFDHTPLLCQRYLIQHNVHWFNQGNGSNRIDRSDHSV